MFFVLKPEIPPRLATRATAPTAQSHNPHNPHSPPQRYTVPALTVPDVPAFGDVESIALTRVKHVTTPRTGLNDISNTLDCLPMLKTQIDGTGETLDGGGDVEW